jgi:hypothetical protein
VRLIPEPIAGGEKGPITHARGGGTQRREELLDRCLRSPGGQGGSASRGA